MTGGKRGRKMFKAKADRLWDMIGEGVVTVALTVLCVVLGVVTAAGLYPLALS